MRNKIIIGNWKMNKSISETESFIKEVNNANIDTKDNLIYGIAVPFTIIPFANNFNQDKNLVISSQDISEHKSGAYTGQISADMLTDQKVRYAIVGHSERRQFQNESDEVINLKAKAALASNITPIICVGETLEQYEKNQSKDIVKKQINTLIQGLDLSKIVIAYEPIWAIGTGKTATIEYAQEMCEFIRGLTSNETLIQYGGSVSPDNINELLNQKDIDGALVGGASLVAQSFLSLIKK